VSTEKSSLLVSILGWYFLVLFEADFFLKKYYELLTLILAKNEEFAVLILRKSLPKNTIKYYPKILAFFTKRFLAKICLMRAR
jgi:hypothetical protein